MFVAGCFSASSGTFACAQDGTCPNGFICHAGVCDSTKGQRTFACADNQTCPGGLGTPVELLSYFDTRYECIAGTCRISCADNSQCFASGVDNEQCNDNYDGHGYCAPRCDGANPCPAGMQCVSNGSAGICTECTQNSQCGQGECCAVHCDGVDGICGNVTGYLGCRPSNNLPYFTSCAPS